MISVKDASDDVSLRVRLSLGLGESTSINQTLDQGVITSDLFQTPLRNR